MTSNSTDGSSASMSQSMMVDTFIPPAQLSPPMDIFSAGYVFFQFPFDFDGFVDWVHLI